MEYGKSSSSSSSFNSQLHPPPPPTTTSKLHPLTLTSTSNSKLFKLLLFVAATLLLASAISAVILVLIRNTPPSKLKPSQAMSRTCSRTRYPTLCLNSLLQFPGALIASDQELVHISLNITLNKVGSALYSASEITNLDMDPHIRSAYADCLELLEDSVSLLDRSLTSIIPAGGGGGGSRSREEEEEEDVVTWLSASLTNQDTCTQGLDQVREEGYVKSEMWERVEDLSEMVSNSLAIYSTYYSDYDDLDSDSGESGIGGGVPIQNRRLMMMGSESEELSELLGGGGGGGYPKWVSDRERGLLEMDATSISINADVVVGRNGSCKTIAEAIKKAPDHGNRRFVIYVTAGR